MGTKLFDGVGEMAMENNTSGDQRIKEGKELHHHSPFLAQEPERQQASDSPLTMWSCSCRFKLFYMLKMVQGPGLDDSQLEIFLRIVLGDGRQCFRLLSQAFPSRAWHEPLCPSIFGTCFRALNV